MFRKSKNLQNNKMADPIFEEKLDSALNHPAQQAIAQAVKQMSNDEPSLAWRSQLNQRLLEEAGKVKAAKRRITLIWRPIAGVAVAGALALAVMLPRTISRGPAQEIGLEASLMRAHIDADRSYELSGTTYASNAATGGGQIVPASYEWQEDDLGAL